MARFPRAKSSAGSMAAMDKLWRKTHLTLISETETGADDKVCVTAGLARLPTKRWFEGKAFAKQPQSLALAFLVNRLAEKLTD